MQNNILFCISTKNEKHFTYHFRHFTMYFHETNQSLNVCSIKETTEQKALPKDTNSPSPKTDKKITYSMLLSYMCMIMNSNHNLKQKYKQLTDSKIKTGNQIQQWRIKNQPFYLLKQRLATALLLNILFVTRIIIDPGENLS